MLRFIKNNLLWSQTFDQAFNLGGTFFSKFNDKRLQEKRYHWRERLGRLSNLTPEEAAFRAYEEFADDYHSRNHHRKDAEAEFLDLAHALEFAAPHVDRDGNYKESRTFLSPRWLGYLGQYEEKWTKYRAEQQRRTDEVTSFRFPMEEIAAAWERLLSGDIPWEAKSVFRGAYPRCSPHDIAAKMIVPMRDVMFWLVVFRTHHLVTEAVVVDRHLYTSDYARTDPETLREPLKTLVSRLR